jgi:hypothetical protein
MDDLDPFSVDINAGGAVLLLIAFCAGMLTGGGIASWLS